jgi:hypothetical protein
LWLQPSAIPQVMMRIDDRQVGFEDGFRHFSLLAADRSGA